MALAPFFLSASSPTSNLAPTRKSQNVSSTAVILSAE